MLLSAGQSRVIYSGALARASVACEYSDLYPPWWGRIK